MKILGLKKSNFEEPQIEALSEEGEIKYTHRFFSSQVFFLVLSLSIPLIAISNYLIIGPVDTQMTSIINQFARAL